MGIETAIIGGALISGASSFFGNKAAADATKSAAGVSERARVQNQENAQPYLDAGKNALGTYMNALGLNGSAAQSAYYDSLRDDPAYRRLLDAGNDAIMRRQSSLGLTGNQGNTLAAISDYSGNLRYTFDQDRLRQIGGVADTGRTAAGALASSNTAGATAQGSAILAGAGYQGGQYNALGQAATGGLQNYLNYTAYTTGRNGSNNLSGR